MAGGKAARKGRETGDTARKFALIGAGPMGLAMAKTLKEQGIPFDGFDANGDVGGLWDIDAPCSTVYQTAHLISSRTTTEFTDFPMPEGTADYPSHRVLRDYFSAFADHFGLRQHYRFGCTIMSTVPHGASGAGWTVAWKDKAGKRHKSDYRGVLIANGTLSEPNMPDFKGKFTGKLIHSADYKSPDIFRGKRALIIGAGNSGCDIAVDAVHHAKSADISLRRGYHFVPKYIFGKPADAVGGAVKLPQFLKKRVDKAILKWFVGDPRRLGFPAPDHDLYESHPIVNSLILFYAGHGDIRVRRDVERFDGRTVHFTDGERADYDLIIAATGYKLHYPFIDGKLLNWKGDAPHLYLNCFHPERDDLFVLGMIEAAGLGWQGRHEQAELVARYIKGLDAGSAAARRFHEKKREPFDDMRGGMKYLKVPRMAYYVHKDTYRGTVRKEIAALTT